MLHLFDTAIGQVAPLEPRHPGQLSIYLCGPTVSGEPHLGHGRLTLTWDVLRRYLRFSGLEVTLVSNVTDIEDKIITRAREEGSSADQVSERYEGIWWETMDRLGVARPDHIPHATEWVGQMIELIGRLIDGGHAYVGGDGVYFASETVEGYGLLARQPLESLRAGARVALDEEAGKRSPVDFVLWKAAKPGEPWWESPWGRGRPGWHTECVVMSLGLLGDRFDLHGGGIDLAFPHHENERAQALAAGHAFAHRWVHSGMVVAEGGEKMSKSLGNTLSLRQLVAARDPRLMRLLVLQSHYRSPMVVSETALTQAAETLRGLDAFAARHGHLRGAAADDDGPDGGRGGGVVGSGSPGEAGDPVLGPADSVDRGGVVDAEAVLAFKERMDNDLDTPGVLAQLFALRTEANTSATAPERAAVLAATVIHLFEEALGLPIGPVGDGIPAEVAALVAERDAARAARDWDRSDALRDQLTTAGWIVEDGAGGTTVRR